VTPRAHLALTVALGLGFAVIATMVATGRPAFDLAVAQWMAAHRVPGGVMVANVISEVGSVVGIVPLGLLCALYLWRRDGWRPVRALAVVAIGASALYGLMNLAFQLPRPPHELRAEDSIGWSFPSGHSTQAVAFWLIVAALLTVGRRLAMRRAATVLALAIIASTGLSRIYLDVHWTTDVLAGLTLGAFWLSLSVLALRRLDSPAARAQGTAPSPGD
jgi:undecaprenyl-diphosphatase